MVSIFVTRTAYMLVYLAIFILFLVTMVFPQVELFGQFYDTLESVSPISVDYALQAKYGIIHIPSLIFIILSSLMLLVLFLSHWSGKSGLADKSSSIQELKSANDKIDELLSKDVADEGFYETLTSEVHNRKGFLRRVLQLFLNGGAEEEVDYLIGRHIESQTHVLRGKLHELSHITAILPLLGMMGTIAGLMMMFSEPGSLDDFEKKFSGLAMALMTTLYATIVTVFIFKPWQKSVARQINRLETKAVLLSYNCKLFYHHINIVQLKESIDSELNEIDVSEQANVP